MTLVMNTYLQLAVACLPAADIVEAVVEREPVQPGSDRCVPLEAANLAVGLQEDLLEQVLAVLDRSANAARQGVNPRRVLPVERLEGVDVSSLAACDEIVGIGMGCALAHLRFFRREGDRRALLWRGHARLYESSWAIV